MCIPVVIACQQDPTPIDYGNQACAYCRMSIVDERYAAQLVNEKTKTYSFDAIECMINFKQGNLNERWQSELVTDYRHPKKLMPAENAWIVRSKQLPSPMGEYLTATSNRTEAEELEQKHGGKIYSYSQLPDLKNLPEL